MKAQRANLALFIVGLALVALAPAWRLAVAPALRVVAVDIERISSFTGTLTTYVRPPGKPPVGAEPERTAVNVEMRASNPIGRSTPEVAVLQVNTALINTYDGRHISDSRHYYAIDRHTAKQVPGHGSDMNRTGYYYIFPFDTPKADLAVWDNLSEAPRKAVYVSRKSDYGVDSYTFRTRYENKPVPAPAGFPSRMTGAQLKAIVRTQGLAIADSDVLRVSYKGNLSTDFLVEPVSGTQVGVLGTQESVSMSVEDQARGFAFTQVIYRLDCTENPASLQVGASIAADEIAKTRLQFAYLPLGFLVFGIACVLIGLFALRRG